MVNLCNRYYTVIKKRARLHIFIRLSNNHQETFQIELKQAINIYMEFVYQAQTHFFISK